MKKINTILYLGIKRIFDIIIGILGLILLFPMTIIIKISRIILKEDDTPIFYSQIRIGKNGKKFRIYKYRSMVKNADEKLQEYLEDNEKAKIEYKKYYKLQDDPRITKIGKILRKTSIDELPQVINILKNDMSLIGPRPVVDVEISKFGENKDKFLSTKPGLTGYWQVNGGNDISYDDRIKEELYYIENRNLLLDIKVFFKTFSTLIEKSKNIKKLDKI